MAIKVSSNQTIVPIEGVFQCNVSKLIDLLIFDAIQQVRLRNKRPDSSAIFKEISKAHATNFTEEDIENRIEGLKTKKNLLTIKFDTEPIPITQQTPEVRKVSRQTEDSNIDPSRIHLW